MTTSQVKENRQLLVICVNYNNNKDTIDFSDHILSLQSTHNLNLLVIDNSNSGNDALKLLLPKDSRIQLLHPEKNLGYFGAASWGLSQYLLTSKLPEWIIVSNTDIVFPDSAIFSKLFEFYPSGFYGIVAPKIHSLQAASDQNPFMKYRPAKSRILFYKTIFRYYPLSLFYQLLSLIRKNTNLSLPKKTTSKEELRINIYAPHGSFIIFHRSYFDAGGNLNHGSFLFGEEIFIAETVRRLSLKVQYDPRIVVNHNEHSTTSFIKNRMIGKYLSNTYDYIYKEFFAS